MDLPVNNFHGDNTEVFPMRYYYNGQFGGPHVVILVGGPWGISPEWTQGGLPFELAREVGAGLFYTEHRYYGQSAVGNDTSLENLRFLSADQALGDLAHFIRNVKSPEYENGRFQHGSVVLAGCWHGGRLAARARLAYPHLVDGALSDGGPLLATEDFPEYMETVWEVVRQAGGAGCASALRDAAIALELMMETPSGLASLADIFNTCSPLGPDLQELATFRSAVARPLAALVQRAWPGDVAAACEALTDDATPDPVQRLAAWVRAQTAAQPCLETSYSQLVLDHTDTSYDAPKAANRLWMYQACSEYGWHQTISNQTTGSAVPLDYYHQVCKDLFGTQFDENLLRSGIERTNLLFAGLSHTPDHVVSVAGGRDPWARVGPAAAQATPRSPVYSLPNASQCRVIRGADVADTEDVDQVKLDVISFLYERATGQPLYTSRASRSFAPIALVTFLFTLLIISCDISM